MYRCLLVISTVQRQETKKTRDLRLHCPPDLTRMTSFQKDLRDLNIFSKNISYTSSGSGMLGTRGAREGRVAGVEQGRKCQRVKGADPGIPHPGVHFSTLAFRLTA